MITLIVTENCNLRCKYCIYSGIYDFERIHNSNNMTFEIAKRSLDYFFQSKVSSRNLTFLPYNKLIGFYGGEPLLRFSLIKKIVKYVHSNYGDENVGFSLTTNGTLITKEIAKYFIDNKFRILISLDGPKSEHDRNRVFINGGGTHATIMKNINHIKKLSLKYFERNIRFIACYDYKSNLDKMLNFFKENKMILSRASLINTKSSKYYDKFTKSDFVKYKKSKDKYLEYYKEILSSCREERSLIDNESNIFTNFSFVSFCEKRQIPTYENFTGTCIPGTKLAVSPDGNFHVCERINQKFPIGNCNKGLEFEKILKLIKKYNEEIIEFNNCKNCIAKNNCGICYANCSRENDFNSKKECELTVLNFKKTLIDIYSILEKNPQIFKYYFENYTLMDT